MKTASIARRPFGLFLGLAFAAVVLVFARPAFAASASGQITQTEYHYNGESWGPQLLLQLNSNGTNYYAQSVTPGCSLPADSIDTMKAFLAVAQSAQLAGKNVVVSYNTCNGFNYIYDIQMQH
jgi:hypothetical protein